jgi:hypothetical protein
VSYSEFTALTLPATSERGIGRVGL